MHFTEFIYSNNFWVASLEFSVYNIMLSANSDSLNFPFPIWISFIYFSFLTAVPRNLNTMLTNSGESGHPCPAPDHRENTFSFSC